MNKKYSRLSTITLSDKKIKIFSFGRVLAEVQHLEKFFLESYDLKTEFNGFLYYDIV